MSEVNSVYMWEMILNMFNNCVSLFVCKMHDDRNIMYKAWFGVWWVKISECISVQVAKMGFK